MRRCPETTSDKDGERVRSRAMARAYPSVLVLYPDRVLLGIRDELTGEGGHDVVWRDVSQAGAQSQGDLLVLGNQGRVDAVPWQDEGAGRRHGLCLFASSQTGGK